MATASSRSDRDPYAAGLPARAMAPAVPPGRDMVWIEGRRFLMGSDRHYPEERPKRRVAVDGFWIDRTPVTNADYARFVQATGHQTFAETAGGSMLFAPTREPVPLDSSELWWSFVEGADWRHPSGPGSSILGRGAHPVVHMSLADVEAYCDWAGTCLPSEEEWELAARGGLADSEFAWGEEFEPDGRRMANIWRGSPFPCVREGEAWTSTSVVTAYPPNGFGLYDMIGNVWEWTADWWLLHPLGKAGDPCCTVKQRASAAADDPLHVPRRVLKGGSHLCAPNHCRRYRPAARQPHPADSPSSHIGFRCAVRTT